MDEVSRLLTVQGGVIARFQALDLGMSRVEVARKLRRREWVQVHPGVYVGHTGPLLWEQRAWAAVLRCWPAALAALSDACGARRTTASRLLEALDARPRMARRRFLRGVLLDVQSGTCSVLEHGYLDLVERAHGLPTGERQRPRGAQLEDVHYVGLGLVVELDGRAFHASTAQRDRDLDRDFDDVVERDGTTVRLGYGQVFRDGCRTARRMAVVMQRLGWRGRPTRCQKCGGPDQPG